MKEMQIKPVLLSIGLTMIACLVYAIGTTFLFLGPPTTIQDNFLISLCVCMPLGFILLPWGLIRHQVRWNWGREIKLDWRYYLLFSALIFLCNHFFIKSEEYIHQFIVSLCEEFLFRYIIYTILRREYSVTESMLISSVIFGVILHMNYPIVDNLLIRTPLGLVLSLVARKYGLHSAIAGHWIYNLLASQF